MVELQEEILDEARSRSKTLLLNDLIELLETHRADEGQGLKRETFRAYAEELDYDMEKIDAEVDNRLTDEHEWTEGDAIYRLGEDRISVYPPDWHDRLEGVTDVREYIKVIRGDVTEPEGEREEAVTSAGVPRQKIYRVAGAVVGMDMEETREQLEQRAKRGELVEHTDQHQSSRFEIADPETDER